VLEPLPIDAAIGDIQNALHRARAVVVVAAPGAGKTTRVPPALLEAGPAILLQPRRAAARAIARRIAAERGWTVGQEVGWHIRFERNLSRHTRLVIATEGILTARLQQDPLLSDFKTIILDEFHERSIHADVAIALSKQALRARDDLRLVVMSATLDATRVSSYLGDCPIVQAPGRTHPLRVLHVPDLPTGEAVARITSETEGNVLCFQPGALEIQRAMADIRPRLAPDIEVLPLHGLLPAAEQDRVLAADRRSRRVIVCTNIAETSITVPGVTGVVDSGLEKVARYDAERAIDSLTTERITQAAADQRAGRAGRIAPGVVYRLWPATDRLRPFRDADINRIDLCGPVLDILAWGGDPRTLDWFEAPRADAVESAIRLLERLGAIQGLALTDIGRQMQHLPLPPRLARIVIAGAGSRAVLRAVAMLAERHVIPPRSESTSSDLLAALDRWAEMPPHVRQVAQQLEAATRHEEGRSAARPAVSDAEFRRAIVAGYPDRVGQRREPRSSRVLLATGTGAVLSPDSGVRDAEFVVALEVQASSRPGDPESRIRLASAVDREWLTPTSTEVEHQLDPRGVVKARQVDRYDALRLAERPIAPDPDSAADLLAAEWLARQMPESDQRLVRRLRFAGCDVDLPRLVRLAAFGVRGLGDIDLARVLPRETVLAIERHAPESLLVPSGRHVQLEYADDGSVSASVKLQELFGLAETPRVGPRQEPVLLALLAPNGRPVQMTRDLKSFWDRTYPDVRKELRGRYPKHPWPEDPWNAAPTARTTRRSG
jgi:ATP-dependent helicase HrpB